MVQNQQVAAKRRAESPPPRAAARPADAVPSHDITASVPDNSETPARVAPLLWRLDQVALALGVDRRTIERLRSAGRFPQPDLKIGRMPLWRPATIEAWIAAGGELR